MEAQPSVVRYVGKSSSNSCGYCKSTQRAVDRSQKKGTSEEGHASSSAPEKKHEASITFGVIAHLLSPEVFSQFLDTGWSRSGRYLYKPVMDETCCPQYTS
ncbi:arginyl-tRNA--protein transferase 1 [Ditylenchus destructor]|nr:arginyl-tRNA--protein transferase 1 [Ditylenchus destructor]